MHIIFGEALAQLPDKYTILELDQFRLPPDGTVVTSYCVVERIPLNEIPMIDQYRDLHNNCVHSYRKREWDFCEHAIESLRGRWNGEVDSFYDHLLQRIVSLKTQDLSDDWNGVIDKAKDTRELYHETPDC